MMVIITAADLFCGSSIRLFGRSKKPTMMFKATECEALMRHALRLETGLGNTRV